MGRRTLQVRELTGEIRKVLLAVHGFPPRHSAGAEWRAWRTARELLGRGYEVEVIACAEAHDAASEAVTEAQENVDGLRVRYLRYGSGVRWGGQSGFRHLGVEAYVAEQLRAGGHEVVHLVSGHRITAAPLFAAHAAGIPSIVSLTDFWFLCPRITLRRATGEVCGVPSDPRTCGVCLAADRRRYCIPLRWAARGGRRLRLGLEQVLARTGEARARTMFVAERRVSLAQALALADRLIAPSMFLRQVFVDQGVPPAKLVFMRQGVEVAGEPIEQAPPDGRPLRVGYIGQLAEHKGVLDLVRAVRRSRHGPQRLQLRLYGDPNAAWPPFMARVRAEIDGDPRIQLRGPFARSELRQVHAGLDLLVVPSRWYENSPNVILEAFACGTPVLAADLGGMRELVGDGQGGALFPVGDTAALSRMLDDFVNDPSPLGLWRERLPAVPSVTDEVDDLLAVYGDVWAERSRRTGDHHRFCGEVA